MSTLGASVCLPAVPDFGPLCFLPFTIVPFSLWEQSHHGSKKDFRVQGSDPVHYLQMTKHLSFRSSTERPAGWAESVLEEDMSEPEPEPEPVSPR